MNIKFPKEEMQIINTIREAILEENHNAIISQYDNIVLNCKSINEYYSSTLTLYIKTLFKMKEFEKMLCLIDDLRKKEIESCEWYFYMFIYLIYKKDLYYIKSIISRSKLLNNDSINYLIDDNEGNYGTILNLHYALLSTIGPCLIIINFINELVNESISRKIDDDYIIMRFFDLLNLLYENGLEDEIVEIFKNSLETLYEIEIV